MKLYLLRHSESQANAQQIYSCALPGSGLTPKGVQDAKSLASNELLSKAKFSVVHVSPFARTLETYHHIKQSCHSLPNPTISPEIGEVNYGQFDGKLIKNVAIQAKIQLDRVGKGDLNSRFGVTGENEFEILRRVYTFLLACLACHRGDSVLCISHQSIISIIRSLVAEIDQSQPKIGTTHNSTVYVVELAPKFKAKIEQRLQQISNEYFTFNDETLYGKGLASISRFIAAPGIPDDLPVTAAVGLIKRDHSYLFTKNTRGYDFAGGHLETYDESPESCFIREAKEELDVDVQIFGTLGYFKMQTLHQFYSDANMPVYPKVSLIPVFSSRTQNLPESSDCPWLSLTAEELHKSKHIPSHIKTIALYNEKVFGNENIN